MKTFNCALAVVVCFAAYNVEALALRYNTRVPQKRESMPRGSTPYQKDCDNARQGQPYCVADNLSRAFVSKDAAAWDVAQAILKDRECRRDWESTHLIYEKDGMYYYGTPQFYSSQQFGVSHTPVDLNHPYVRNLVNGGYKVVATIHPHPSGSWFSLADAKAAKALGIDSYLLPCFTPTSINRNNRVQPIVYVLDHSDGVVYPIVRGRRESNKGFRSAPGQYKGKDDAYQGVAQYQRLAGAQVSGEIAEASDDRRRHAGSSPLIGDASVASVDTSRLEALLREQLVLVRALLAKGKRATDDEVDAFNSRQEEIVNETMSIAGKINAFSVPDDEKLRIAQKTFAKATAISMQLQKEVNQVIARKLIGGLKPFAPTGLNGTAPSQTTEEDDDRGRSARRRP